MDGILSLFTTENIIQGGGILIALVLAWIVYKLTTNHSKHLEAVVDRNTQAWKENSSSNLETAKALTSLVTTLELTHKKKKR